MERTDSIFVIKPKEETSIMKLGYAMREHTNSFFANVSPSKIFTALRCISLALVLGCTSQMLAASNHYVLAGAVGNQSGADWANAYVSLPKTLIRGDTYYIGVGKYNRYSYNTPASGTSVITIKKATSSDHGTDTGWNDSFAGQATFPEYNPINTSYWSIDGQTGTDTDLSTYGFRIYTAGNSGLFIGESAVTITGITINKVAFEAPGTDTGNYAINCFTQLVAWNNSTVSKCLFVGQTNAIVANGTNGACDNITFTQNICYKGASSASYHGEQVNANGAKFTNLTVSKNQFLFCVGTGVVMANNSSIVGAVIEGNVFADCETGNGVIGSSSSGSLVNVTVSNNTFVRCKGGLWFGAGVGSPIGNVARDNALFGMSGATAGVSVQDSNSYYQCTSVPSEVAREVSTAMPFKDANGDYRLAAPTITGVVTAFVTDLDHPTIAIRGVDGSWDRGAFEYVANASNANVAPSNAKIAIILP